MTHICNYMYVLALKGLFVFIVAYVGQGQKQLSDSNGKRLILFTYFLFETLIKGYCSYSTQQAIITEKHSTAMLEKFIAHAYIVQVLKFKYKADMAQKRNSG